MPQIQPRKLSYGEIRLNKRLAKYAKHQEQKRNLKHPINPNKLTMIRPSHGAYGELTWSPDNC